MYIYIKIFLLYYNYYLYQYYVVIADLQDDGAASKAGLKIGDVITKIDDKEISSLSKLRYYLYQYSIGDKVKVTYIRNNKTLETTVKLEGN